MAPPPSTPAQSRFLLHKKSQPPQTEGQARLPSQNGPRRFVSTPRLDTSATPRPDSHHTPPFSLPVASSARHRATPREPLSDVIDTSPISSEATQDDNEHNSPFYGSMEIESPSASAPPPRQFQINRPAKRRRVSVSPEIEASPDAYQDDLENGVDERIHVSSTLGDDNSIAVQSPLNPQRLMADSQPQSPQAVDEQAPRHPTFHSAPRFKVTETMTETQQTPLPDAFSPQRRGTKYVAGGLAAQVRDWLVQVNGSSEYDRPAGSAIHAVVDAAVSAPGMHIIAARLSDVGAECDKTPARVILAGDGRTKGLRGRSPLRRSGVVSMSQPMWDITLVDLGQFAVACDWETK